MRGGVAKVSFRVARAVRLLQWNLMDIEFPKTNIGKRKEMEISNEKEPPFQLTVEEDALFALLIEVVEHFKLQAVLRVAGGWVRDKLMASTLQCNEHKT